MGVQFVAFSGVGVASVSSYFPECQKWSFTSFEISGRHSYAAVAFQSGDGPSREKCNVTSIWCKRIAAATSGQSLFNAEVGERRAAICMTSSTAEETSASSSISPEFLETGTSKNGATSGEASETGDATLENMGFGDAAVPLSALTRGTLFRGVVSAIHPYGVFVRFGAYADGFVHISKLGSGYVRNVNDVVSLGQTVSVIILNVEQSSGRIALSMVQEDGNQKRRGRRPGRFRHRSISREGKADTTASGNPSASSAPGDVGGKGARVAHPSELSAFSLSTQNLGYCGG